MPRQSRHIGGATAGPSKADGHALSTERVPRHLGVHATWPWTALAVLGAMGMMAPFFGPHLTYALLQSARSVGRPVRVGDLPALCRPIVQSGGGIEVTGVAEVSQFTTYQDVFQTSPVNQGVRMEIGRSGSITTVAAIVGGASGQPYGISETAPLRRGEPWSFRLTVYASGALLLSVAGKAVTAEMPTPAPLCDSLVVGGGFDASRRFHGDVTANFTVAAISPAIPGASAIHVGAFLLLAWLASGLVGMDRRKTAPTASTGAESGESS